MQPIILSGFLLLPSLVLAYTPKRGLAYDDYANLSYFAGSNSQVNWQFNWDSTTDSSQSFTEYVPMLYCDSKDSNEWFINVEHWIGNGGSGNIPSKHIMGFDEANLVSGPGGCPLTPGDAANSYRTLITPFHTGVALVSPSVVGGPDSITWMQEFKSACTGCYITYYDFHWFDTNIDEFKDYVSQACAAVAPNKIWMSEFATTSTSASDRSTFMAAALTFLDDQACVDRYAWNGYPIGSTDTNDLWQIPGPQLTSLGAQYKDQAF